MTRPYAKGLAAWLRALAVAGTVLAGGYAVALALYARAYADSHGDMSRLLGGEFDPKDYVPGGMHAANPLMYGYLVVALSALLGWVYGAPFVVAAVPLLALARGRVAPRVW